MWILPSMPQYISVCSNIKMFNPISSSKTDALGRYVCLFCAFISPRLPPHTPRGTSALVGAASAAVTTTESMCVHVSPPLSSLKDAVCLLSSLIWGAGHQDARKRQRAWEAAKAKTSTMSGWSQWFVEWIVSLPALAQPHHGCGPFFKILHWICYNTVSVLCFGLFWPRGTRDLRSQSRNQIVPPTLEGEVLTTRPPGKSQHYHGESSLHQAEMVFFPAHLPRLE